VVKDHLAPLYDSVGPRAVVELVILTLLVLALLRFLGKRQGSGLVRGLGLLLIAAFVVAQLLVFLFDLTVLGLIVDYLHTTVLVGLLVVFQPELRRGLMRLGRYPVLRYLVNENDPVADRLAEAALALSRECVGALIAIQRTETLEPYAQTGERLDAELSPTLVRTVFCRNSPLHDGAVILESGRITAAACQLPLGQPPDRERAHLGMRHRAALALSDETDAVLLVVSEETGRVSLAVAGRLEPVARENVSRRLVELLSTPSVPNRRAA
jgi:diadenylate cyclase